MTLAEDTTKFNQVGYEQESRASLDGEQAYYCAKYKQKVTLPVCYSCHKWNGLKQMCDEGHQVPLNETYNIPISYNEALKTKTGTHWDVLNEWREGLKLKPRKIA